MKQKWPRKDVSLVESRKKGKLAREKKVGSWTGQHQLLMDTISGDAGKRWQCCRFMATSLDAGMKNVLSPDFAKLSLEHPVLRELQTARNPAKEAKTIKESRKHLEKARDDNGKSDRQQEDPKVLTVPSEEETQERRCSGVTGAGGTKQ